MPHHRLVAVALCCMPMLGACGIVSSLFAPFYENRTTAPESPFADSGLKTYFQGVYLTPDNVKAELEKYHAADDEVARQRIRNDLVTALIFLVDTEYEHYTDKLMTNKSGWNFFATLGKLGVDAAGAVTSHAGTSKLMSAISGGLTGASSAFDVAWFAEKSVPIIVTQMNASRLKQRELIMKQLVLPTLDYPIAQALSEAVDYYNRGTLVNALAEFAENAAKSQEKAQDKKDSRVEALVGPLRRQT